MNKQGSQKRDIEILLNLILSCHLKLLSKHETRAKGIHILFKL